MVTDLLKSKLIMINHKKKMVEKRTNFIDKKDLFIEFIGDLKSEIETNIIFSNRFFIEIKDNNKGFRVTNPATILKFCEVLLLEIEESIKNIEKELIQ